MKKTLAVLMAALLVAACFATVGSAADMTVAFIENYDSNVVLLPGAGTFDALTDGVTTPEELDWLKMTDAQKKQVVAFQNNNCILNEAEGKNPIPASRLGLVVDLGETKTLESLSVWFYKCYIVMIGLGVENTLSISASTDGTNFTPVMDYDFESDPAVKDGATNSISEVQEEVIEFDAPVTARYLELTMDYEESYPSWVVDSNDPSKGTKPIWEFIAMTEIIANEATGGGDTSEPADDTSSEPADDTSSEAPATSSEAPAASSAPTSSTPPTGDAGFAAIAVVAVVALAGAALIVRKRS